MIDRDAAKSDQENVEKALHLDYTLLAIGKAEITARTARIDEVSK